MPLYGPTKVGFDKAGVYQDISALTPLPMGGGSSAEITVTISSLAPTTGIDTGDYRFASVQMTAGYSGMTSLTVQGSNDNTNWFTAGGTTIGATSSGITSNLGTTANIIVVPLNFRYVRFNPAGTYSSGSCVLKITLYSDFVFMPSVGTNTNLSAVGGSIAPAIANSVLTIGVATGNGFQDRVTGSADVAATSFKALTSGQIYYVTAIHTSVWDTGTTPRQFRLVGNGSALIEHNVLCPPNESYTRTLRNPWKTVSATGIALNYAVTSIGTAAGNWELVVEGYCQSS